MARKKGRKKGRKMTTEERAAVSAMLQGHTSSGKALLEELAVAAQAVVDNGKWDGKSNRVTVPLAYFERLREAAAAVLREHPE
jgi:hypothetical protein